MPPHQKGAHVDPVESEFLEAIYAIHEVGNSPAAPREACSHWQNTSIEENGIELDP